MIDTWLRASKRSRGDPARADLLQLATNASDTLKKNVAVNKQAAEVAVNGTIADAESAIRTAGLAAGLVWCCRCWRPCSASCAFRGRSSA